MLTKTANTEDQRLQFVRLPPQQDGGEGLCLENANGRTPSATNGGEIVDEHGHCHTHHHRHENGEQRSANKSTTQTTPLSPSDSHAVVGWLKGNAPAWLLAMLGLTPPRPGSTAAPSNVPRSQPGFCGDVAQHASAEAAEILADDVRLWQNRIYLATDDLHDIVAHPSQHPPATVDAAQTMLDYPAEFRKADGANTGGSVDGQVWKQDLIVYAKNIRAEQANAANQQGMPTDEAALAHFMQLAQEAAAARVRQAQHARQGDQSSDESDAAEARQALQDDADLWHGKSILSSADLQNVLLNPTAHPPQTVVASLFMLQHPESFRDAANMTRSTPSTDADDVADDSFTARLQRGAELASNDAFALLDDAIDMANRGGLDLNSQAPTTQSFAALPLDTTGFADDGPEAVEAMQILLDDASLWVNKNGNTAQDLQNVVDHPEQNAPDTVAAATFLLQHPATFRIADGLASGGAIDGQIWKRDLVAAIDQANAAETKATAFAEMAPSELAASISAELNTSAGFDTLAGGSFGDDVASDFSMV